MEVLNALISKMSSFPNMDHQNKLLLSIYCNDLVKIQQFFDEKTVYINYIYGKPYDKTALEIACCEFIAEIKQSTIRLLLENGAVYAQSIYYAATENNEVILKELLENNDNLKEDKVIISLINYINRENKNEENYLTILRLLLEKVDINTKEENGCSAIYLAAQYSFKNIVNLTLETCYDIIDLDNYVDELTFMTARDLIQSNNLYEDILPDPIVDPRDSITLNTLLKNIRHKREHIFFINYTKFKSCDDKDHFEEDDNILLLAAAERGLVNIVRYFLHAGVDSNKIFTHFSELFPLKYACVRGFYEIVEILLCYSNYNIVNITLIELVRTKFEIKENAKINHFKCLELLLRNKLTDITFRDIEGNTALHYAAMHQICEITLMILRKGGSLTSKNNNGKMVVEFLDTETFENHLNECITYCKFTNIPNRHLLEVNFSSLLPEIPIIKTDNDFATIKLQKPINNKVSETTLFEYMTTKNEIKHLLHHPVVDIFLYLKWHSIKKYQLLNLLLYVAFLGLLISFICVKYRCNEFQELVSTWLITFTILLFLRESVQLFIFQIQYFKKYENWIEICLLTSTVAIYSVDCNDKSLINQLCAIIVVCSALELMLLSGRQFRILFISSMMLQTVSKTLFKWVLSYAILIMAFAGCFFFIFNINKVSDDKSPTMSPNSTKEADEKNEYFDDLYRSLFKTIVMLTGEFEMEDLDFQTHFYVGSVIFVVFVFLINIVLLGVCTALAISDIQIILNEAETKMQIVRIDHIIYWDRIFSLGGIINYINNLPEYFQIKQIKDNPLLKVHIFNNNVKIEVYKVCETYLKHVKLDVKTLKNIITKTQSNAKSNLHGFPTVDENFFFNLRKTFAKVDMPPSEIGFRTQL